VVGKMRFAHFSHHNIHLASAASARKLWCRKSDALGDARLDFPQSMSYTMYTYIHIISYTRSITIKEEYYVNIATELVPTKNNQEKGVRWAKDYEL
jgi:hypothetical protein